MKIIQTLLLGLFLSIPAYANYPCTGTVKYIGTGDGGNNAFLFIDNGYGIHRLCNMSDQDIGRAQTCKSWLSIAMTAQAQSLPISIFHLDDTGKTKSECTSIGDWVAPADRPYFMVIDRRYDS